jgi:hypothetical protein
MRIFSVQAYKHKSAWGAAVAEISACYFYFAALAKKVARGVIRELSELIFISATIHFYPRSLKNRSACRGNSRVPGDGGRRRQKLRLR